MPIAHAKDFYTIDDNGIRSQDTVDEFALKANATINQIDKLAYFKYALDNKLMVPDGQDVTFDGGLIINGGNLYADRASAQKIKGISIDVDGIEHNDVLTYDSQRQVFAPTRGLARYYGPYAGVKVGNVYKLIINHSSDVMVQVFGYVRAKTNEDQTFQLRYGFGINNLDENRLLVTSDVIDTNIIHQKANTSQRHTYIRPAVMAGMIKGAGTRQIEFEIPQSVEGDNDEERFGVHFLLYCSGHISGPSVVEPIPANQLEAGVGDSDEFAKKRLSRLDEIEKLKD